MQINYIVKASNKRRALHYWKKLNSKIFLSSWRFLEEAKAQAASNHWSTVMKESSYNDAKKNDNGHHILQWGSDTKCSLSPEQFLSVGSHLLPCFRLKIQGNIWARSEAILLSIWKPDNARSYEDYKKKYTTNPQISKIGRYEQRPAPLSLSILVVPNSLTI